MQLPYILRITFFLLHFLIKSHIGQNMAKKLLLKPLYTAKRKLNENPVTDVIGFELSL